jgi:hypothetical protein
MANLIRNVLLADKKSIDTWGMQRHSISRRRFYKVVGTLPSPYGRLLEDWGDIWNCVAVEYTELNMSSFPAWPIGQRTTAWAQDIDSQNRFGKRIRVLHGPVMSSLSANTLRDIFLEQHSSPYPIF